MAAPLPCSTCTVHGKATFASRSKARQHARRVHPASRLNAYRCDVNGLWHLGHLPEPVRQGKVSRDTIINQRIREPERY